MAAATTTVSVATGKNPRNFGVRIWNIVREYFTRDMGTVSRERDAGLIAVADCSRFRFDGSRFRAPGLDFAAFPRVEGGIVGIAAVIIPTSSLQQPGACLLRTHRPWVVKR